MATPVAATPGRDTLRPSRLAVVAVLLLAYVFFHPWFSRQPRKAHAQLHPQSGPLTDWIPPAFRYIAIALDFSAHDEKLLAYALAQGGKDCDYLLIHVVESASANTERRELGAYCLSDANQRQLWSSRPEL